MRTLLFIILFFILIRSLIRVLYNMHEKIDIVLE